MILEIEFFLFFGNLRYLLEIEELPRSILVFFDRLIRSDFICQYHCHDFMRYKILDNIDSSHYLFKKARDLVVPGLPDSGRK